MNKKKVLIVVLNLIGVAAITLAVAFILKDIKDIKSENLLRKNSITAGEWIEMLSEHTGCDEIVLPSGYDMDSIADGKLISITAMKTVDIHRYKRLIDDIESYNDEDYYRLAKEYELIEEDKKNYTLDECNAILLKYNEIYFNDLWLDDYCEIEYMDHVTEVDETSIVQSNEDYSVVSFSNDSKFSQGEIIVFSDDKGIKRMGRVDSIDETGAYHLLQPDISEVVKEIDCSDIKAITYDDFIQDGVIDGEIVSNNALPDDLMAYDKGMIALSYYNENAMKENNSDDVYHYDTTFDGIEITVSAEDNDNFDGKFMAISVADKGSGETVTYKSPIMLDSSADGALSIGLNDITIAADTTYFNFKEDEKYAEFRLDIDTTIKGELSLGTDEDDFKLPLAHFNLPFEGGFVSLDFELYLQMTAEGKFEIAASLPTSVCIREEKGKGIRSVKNIDNPSTPSIESAISGEILLSLNLDAKLYIFWFWDIIGAGVKAGALGQGEIIERDNGLSCTDFSVAFPVVSFNAYFNGIIDKFEAEFEIISPDEAPYKWSYHYEELPGVRHGRVEECTYGNDELFEQYNAEADTETQVNSNVDLSFLYGSPNTVNIFIKRSDVRETDVTDEHGELQFRDVDAKMDVVDTGSGYCMNVACITYELGVSREVFDNFIQQAIENDGNYEVDAIGDKLCVYKIVEGKEILNCMGEDFKLTYCKDRRNGRGYECEFLGEDGETYHIVTNIESERDSFTNEAVWKMAKDGQVATRRIEYNDMLYIEVSYDMSKNTFLPTFASGEWVNANEAGMGWYFMQFDADGNIVQLMDLYTGGRVDIRDISEDDLN